MDQYTGVEMIEELKEIVKDWRVESERLWGSYRETDVMYYRDKSTAISACADRLEELIAKYDVK